MAQEEDPDPKTWQAALARVRQAENYDDHAIGYAGIESATFRSYKVLRSGAPTEVLLELCRDADPVVRAYAVRALVEENRDTDLAAVVLAAARDREPLPFQQGCCLGKEPFADVVMWDVLDALPAEARARVVHTVVFEDGPSPTRTRLLCNEAFGPVSRAQLRAFADAGEDPALVALARYGDGADQLRILRALSRPQEKWVAYWNALRAASLDPHPSFREALVQVGTRACREAKELGAARIDPWVAAMVAHDHPDAAAVLVRFLDAEARSDYKRFRRAQQILEHWGDEKRESFDTLVVALAKLGVTDRTRLGSLATRNAEIAEACCEWVLDRSANERTARATGAALDLLRERAPVRAVERCRRALQHCGHQDAEVLARRAAHWQDARLVPALCARLITTDNPHIYLPLTRALLVFDSDELDALVRAQSREGWGAEALTELLAEMPRSFADE